MNDHLEVVKFLVEKTRPSAEVDIPDISGHMPLTWVATNGHLDMVKFLVEAAGADVESKFGSG